MEKTYTMEIAGLKRELPLFKVADDLYIAAFIMFGDVEITKACAQKLLDMGLDIPEITRVFLKLQSLGLDVPQVYTVEQAMQALTSLKGGRADA